MNSDPRLKALKEVSRVYGIGPSLARTLVDDNDVRTLQDLHKPAIQAMLSNNSKIGLRLLPDLEQRIPRTEVKELEVVVRGAATPLGLTVTICGSYRRGRPDSGDIDWCDNDHAYVFHDYTRHMYTAACTNMHICYMYQHIHRPYSHFSHSFINV